MTTPISSAAQNNNGQTNLQSELSNKICSLNKREEKKKEKEGQKKRKYQGQKITKLSLKVYIIYIYVFLVA